MLLKTADGRGDSMLGGQSRHFVDDGGEVFPVGLEPIHSTHCPICLHDYNDTDRPHVFGPCRHGFCLPCIEHLLTSPTVLSRHPQDEDVSTTWGQCPLCRAEVSLFDLRYHHHGRRKIGQVKTARETMATSQHVIPYNDDTSWDTTPLRNSVYAVHQSHGTNLPVIVFGECSPDTTYCELPSTTNQELRYRCRQLQFHTPTRTCDLQFVVPAEPVTILRMVLTFSYDWRFVTRGRFFTSCPGTLCNTTGTTTTTPPSMIAILLGGRSGPLYRRIAGPDTTSVVNIPPSAGAPTYHPQTIWGNTFCQAFTVGLASYHFVSPDNIYISYEHPSIAQWPPLDNGMPIPSRVPFRNAVVEVNEANGTTMFRGQICWYEDFGTTWHDHVQWDYQFVVDSAQYCILQGRVRCVTRTGIVNDLSTFGESLLYINAALFNTFRHNSDHRRSEANNAANNNIISPTIEDFAIMSNHISNIDNSSNDNNNSRHHPSRRGMCPFLVQSSSNALRERLHSEGGTIRIIAVVHNLWTRAHIPHAVNPIVDVNGTPVGEI